MRVGILGAGQMAGALGAGWAAAGHDVFVGARDVDKAVALSGAVTGKGHRELVNLPGRSTSGTEEGLSGAAAGRPARGTVRGGTLREAAEFGEALLLAVPAAAVADVLAAGGAADKLLVDRVVVDCTNAFAPDEAAKEGPLAFVLSEEALAERVAALAPGAHVVKAFNLCAAEVWQSEDRIFEGRRLAVPLCGDDAAAVQRVAVLVSDLGLAPVHAGGLSRARYLEAMSAFVVSLWFAGEDARAMFPPLEAAFAVPDDER
ncbi:NADPH-dependent F420 reductase [Yinghuangia sp. YIM S09857]|uniref:NADPH-dependent F420 reductase n=1 Tax=Yinghuangia sp. YIM S09857 TaxID=3436929 RepID=UPI003F53653D